MVIRNDDGRVVTTSGDDAWIAVGPLVQVA